jgi:hypothetical protein
MVQSSIAVHESLNNCSSLLDQAAVGHREAWARNRCALCACGAPRALSLSHTTRRVCTAKKEAVALGTVQVVSCLTAKQLINTRGGHATVALASRGSAVCACSLGVVAKMKRDDQENGAHAAVQINGNSRGVSEGQDSSSRPAKRRKKNRANSTTTSSTTSKRSAAATAAAPSTATPSSATGTTAERNQAEAAEEANRKKRKKKKKKAKVVEDGLAREGSTLAGLSQGGVLASVPRAADGSSREASHTTPGAQSARLEVKPVVDHAKETGKNKRKNKRKGLQAKPPPPQSSSSSPEVGRRPTSLASLAASIAQRKATEAQAQRHKGHKDAAPLSQHAKSPQGHAASPSASRGERATVDAGLPASVVGGPRGYGDGPAADRHGKQWTWGPWSRKTGGSHQKAVWSTPTSTEAQRAAPARPGTSTNTFAGGGRASASASNGASIDVTAAAAGGGGGGGGGGVVPANGCFDGSERSLPFVAESADHAETPVEAYRDIAPLLDVIATSIGKTRATLRIYDPYFCDGELLPSLLSNV